MRPQPELDRAMTLRARPGVPVQFRLARWAHIARGALCFALWQAAPGCRPNLPPAYVHEVEAAESAYQARDYAGAVTHWRLAAARSPNPRARDEARYREAVTEERRGETERAATLYRELAAGHGERAERAAFALAELALARGPEAAAYGELERALTRFPNSGLARTAARRLIEYVARSFCEAAASQKLELLISRTRGTELEEPLLYLRAQRLEAAGALEAAEHAYLEQAARFAYPFGAFWDEALRGAARIEERLGRPRQAIALLERLLSERETSRISGSYERTAFAQARFEIARLYRDALADPQRAAREYRRLFEEHPTSLLRDDALFEEALIELQSGDFVSACKSAQLIASEIPDSRYASCAKLLCSTERARGMCRAPLTLRITDARARSTGETVHSSSSSR